MDGANECFTVLLLACIKKSIYIFLNALEGVWKYLSFSVFDLSWRIDVLVKYNSGGGFFGIVNYIFKSWLEGSHTKTWKISQNRSRGPSVGSSWISCVFQLQWYHNVSFELSSQLVLLKSSKKMKWPSTW